MPNREQSALLVHRENYIVPKGQERVVHIKIAKLTADGSVLEPARIVREEPKFFDTVAKRNLETLGYTVEILFHPDGKYTSVRIEDKDAKLREAATALSEKDEEIARLKAELAKAKEAKPAEQAKPAEPEKPAKAKKETKKEEK
jgi:rRNA processing protein Gar1